MNATGTSLLEVVFAMTIAVTVSTGLAKATEACGRVLTTIKLQHQALSAARNLLEGYIAASCASPVSCPDNLRCSITAIPLYGSTRVSVRVDGGAASARPDVTLAELTTVVVGSWPCS